MIAFVYDVDGSHLRTVEGKDRWTLKYKMAGSAVPGRTALFVSGPRARLGTVYEVRSYRRQWLNTGARRDLTDSEKRRLAAESENITTWEIGKAAESQPHCPVIVFTDEDRNETARCDEPIVFELGTLGDPVKGWALCECKAGHGQAAMMHDIVLDLDGVPIDA